MRSRCAGVRRANRHLPHRLVTRHGQLEILEHGVVLEYRRLLEFAPDARLGDLGSVYGQQIDRLAEPRRAAVRARFAGDDIHHGRLAGAVGPDDAAQLARLDVQSQRVERLEAVEADGDVLDVQNEPMRAIGSQRQRIARSKSAPRAADWRYASALTTSRHRGGDIHDAAAVRACGNSPMTPRGRNSVTSTNSAPKAYSHIPAAPREIRLRVIHEQRARSPRHTARRGRRPRPR
jgi:hypothetical protein